MGIFDHMDPIWQDTLRSTAQAMVENPGASWGDTLGYAAGSYLGNRMFGQYGKDKEAEERAARQAQAYVNSPQSMTSQAMSSIFPQAPTAANLGSNLQYFGQGQPQTQQNYLYPGFKLGAPFFK